MFGFGKALDVLQQGYPVTRHGWNGKRQFLVFVPGSTFEVQDGRPMGRALPQMVGEQITYRDHIDIRTVQGELVPWVASQSDLLAEDWDYYNEED